MPHDDPIDDEDWYNLTDRCPACGYWLTEADRSAMWSGASKPKWVLITAGVILVVLVIGMLTLRF